MRVLHDGAEHCDSCVRIVGFGAVVVLVEDICIRERAHAPSLGQAWDVSVRWSRQNLLAERS